LASSFEVSLYPNDLASRIVNLEQWRRYLFERLRQQILVTRDEVLQALLDELRGYDISHRSGSVQLEGEALGVLMPFRFQTDHGILDFISTVTVFGSPVECLS
jgi:hypothetical protein